VRTLVVSDLHLGARLRRDVLSRPEPLARLLAALDGVQRLVLLGDIVELLQRRPQRAMSTAEPVLRALGERLGPEREAIIVPGNHDAVLVRPWVLAQGPQLRPDSAVPLTATPMLARLGEWLSPARVRVHYPGVWLSEGIWATHGHYLDRHLLPESTVGIARGLLGRLPRDGALPIEYELAGGPSVTRLESLLAQRLPRPLAALAENAAELLRAASMPRGPWLLLHPRLAPLTSMLLGLQMRHASIPAMARVIHRLGVGAEFVVFGHVHRRGPLDGERLVQWQGPGGRPQMVNTGSWVYEPLLVHRARTSHPYWPGGAVILEPGAPPRSVGLLDGLDAGALSDQARIRWLLPNSCHR
jgi:UDP-2,3-diacylglucosamine pyrophosphatase LpxH